LPAEYASAGHGLQGGSLEMSKGAKPALHTASKHIHQLHVNANHWHMMMLPLKHFKNLGPSQAHQKLLCMRVM
jgi:hypothetical protein